MTGSCRGLPHTRGRATLKCLVNGPLPLQDKWVTRCESAHPTHAQARASPVLSHSILGHLLLPSGHPPDAQVADELQLARTGQGQQGPGPPSPPGPARPAPRARPTRLAPSPGHGTPWQPLVSRPPPLQPLPPIWGTGELQSRIRVMLPGPQVTEQEDHGDQWLQPPSCRTDTGETRGISGRPPGPGFGCCPGGGEGPSQSTGQSWLPPPKGSERLSFKPSGPGPGAAHPPAQGWPAA